MIAGRFFDEDDTRGRGKVAVVTQDFAKRMFGSEDGAIGQTVKVSNLPFVIENEFPRPLAGGEIKVHREQSGLNGG